MNESDNDEPATKADDSGSGAIPREPIEAESMPRPRAASVSSRAPVDWLEAGATFGAYVVGPCIGQGGMARIYRAEHEGLQRPVALKVMMADHVVDEWRERFLREARIAAAIKHPNVVNIFDVGVENGLPFMAMELLEGEDLEAFLESNGSVDESTLVDVMVPVVAGLTAVHDAGVVHRDLKPGNVFLARERHGDIVPKLLDFGISKSSGTKQFKLTDRSGRQMMGTPFYMPPEAIHGHEMTDRSDQYSVGVLMYECATGHNPFAADSIGEVVQRIATGNYVPISERAPQISKKLARIIERTMSLSPLERYADARELGRELLALAGARTRITWGTTFASEGVESAREARRQALARAADFDEETVATSVPARKRAAFWLAAALLGLLVLLIGIRLFRPPSQPLDRVASAPPVKPSAPSPKAAEPPAPPAPLAVAKSPLRGNLREKDAKAPDSTTAFDPAAEGAEGAEAAEAEDSLKREKVLVATSEAKESPAPKPRPSRAARRRARSSSSSTSARRKATRKPSRKTQVATSPEPAWAMDLKAAAPAAGPRAASSVGTNNAPILD